MKGIAGRKEVSEYPESWIENISEIDIRNQKIWGQREYKEENTHVIYVGTYVATPV